MGEDVGPATLAVPKEEGHPTKPMPISAGVKGSFFFAWSARTSPGRTCQGKTKAPEPISDGAAHTPRSWNRLAAFQCLERYGRAQR
jgi:hypothetical protein